jgi:putative peptidoglycan lipid II flippase
MYLKSGLVVALLLLAGRVAGFFREWLIAAKAGASEATDVVIILLTFPDLMVGLLLGGGLASTLVPAFKHMDPGAGSALLLQVSRLVGFAFLLIAGILALWPLFVLDILAPGLPSGLLEVHAGHFRLLTLALPLAALSGVTVAFLNAKGRFAAGASGTLIFNLTVIAGLLIADVGQMIVAVTLGVLGGVLLRLASQVHGLRCDWHRPSSQTWLVDTVLVRQFLGNFSFLTLLVLLPPLARAVASLGELGSLSLFNFAYKLIELPMGVVVGSISTVLLSRLAGDFAQNGMASAQASLVTGMRVTMLICLGIAIPGVAFSDVLVQIVFFRASFSPDQLNQLSCLTAIGFVFFPFQGMLSIYGSAFAARGYTRPLVWSALAMLFLIAISAPLAQAAFGLVGVMAAYGGVYLFGVILLSGQIDSVFGIGTLTTSLKNAYKHIFIPGILAGVVALIGEIMSAGLLARTLWAMASFGVYVISAMMLDRELRNHLRHLAEGK